MAYTFSFKASANSLALLNNSRATFCDDEILTLDTFPERFRIMDSEPEKRMELRRMLVDNYSVFYTIRDERVIVTDVLYTASDIEARLRGEL